MYKFSVISNNCKTDLNEILVSTMNTQFEIKKHSTKEIYEQCISINDIENYIAKLTAIYNSSNKEKQNVIKKKYFAHIRNFKTTFAQINQLEMNEILSQPLESLFRICDNLEICSILGKSPFILLNPAKIKKVDLTRCNPLDTLGRNCIIVEKINKT